MYKVGIKPKNYSTRDAYKLYTKKLLIANPTYKTKDAGGRIKTIIDSSDKVVATYKEFKLVITLFDTIAGTKLLNGYSLDLLNGLGYLFIVTKQRNPKNPRLDRGASYKLRKELKEQGTLTKTNWLVYYTDDDYCKFHWFKLNNWRANGEKLDDLKLYSFKPAGGSAGMGYKNMMSKEIRLNPGLKAFYPFIPYQVLN